MLLLGEILKEQFVHKTKQLFIGQSFEELLFITNEALFFGIKKEELVKEYMSLFLINKDLFKNKPAWMQYVLADTDFFEEDKINYIKKKLNK